MRYCFWGPCLLLIAVSSLPAQDDPPPPAPAESPQETTNETPEQESQRQVVSFADLIQLLDVDKAAHETNVEQEYVVVPVKRGPIDSVMVIRWALKDGVMHFIQVIPLEIPAERQSAFDSAIIRLNHAYPVPGLGMNHDAGTVYFRFTIPVQPRGFVTRDDVRNYFSYTLQQAATLYPTLVAVASGKVEPEDALAFHNARMRGPQGPIGKWQREFSGSLWSLEIQPEGGVTLQRDDKVVVKSQAQFGDGELTLNDVEGPLAAEGAGKYSFTRGDDGTLQLTAIEDTSDGRKKVLTGGTWNPAPPPASPQ